MSAAPPIAHPGAARGGPDWVRLSLLAVGLGFVLLFLVLPLAAVFSQALSKGWQAYGSALAEPDAQAALRLTLLIAAIAVPLNLVFGVAAAWAIASTAFAARPCSSAWWTCRSPCRPWWRA